MNTVKNIESTSPAWLKIIQQQVDSVRFGVVQIVIHDNRVVQIERTEKVRLEKIASTPDDTSTFHAFQTTGGKTKSTR